MQQLRKYYFYFHGSTYMSVVCMEFFIPIVCLWDEEVQNSLQLDTNLSLFRLHLVDTTKRINT